MLSVIVPTRDERENIEPLLERLAAVRDALPEPMEVLVVDDESRDGTADAASRLLARHALGRVIGDAGSRGLSHAVLEGARQAAGDLIGVMDADLSHPPETIPGLVKAVRAGSAIAVASRYVPGGRIERWPWRRRLLSRVGNWLARPLTPVRDVTSGFFVCWADRVRSLTLRPTGYKILLELLARGRIRDVVEVPYAFSDRQRGLSKLGPRVLWQYLAQVASLYLDRANGARHERVPNPSVCRQSVSVVVPAKNEEETIARCLESVRWADQLIVVDDHSTDATADIARGFGATVVRRRFDTFTGQANFGLEHATAEWVLSMDADEVMTPLLRAKIEEALRDPGDLAGISFNRLNFFLGRCMRHGGWHHRSFHLFRRSAGRFAGAVHHGPAVTGRILHLDADMEHHPYQSLTQFVDRQNWYTSMEAAALRREHPALTGRRLRRQLCVRPLKLFWKSYVKKQGRREGTHGLVFGILFAWVEFLKWAKWWQLGLPQDDAYAVPAALAPAAAPRPPPATARARLSAVLIARNEEHRIARCLSSVAGWADEIVVVDGESTDRTAEICLAYGARVVPHAFSGDFGLERNVGNEAATGDWILQLDADDAVSPALRAQIERILRDGSPHAAYKFRRRNWFLGHEMRHGGWYHYYPHLFRRGQAHFEGRVHHLLKVDGTMGTLEGDLEHRPFDSLEQFVSRHNRYTTIEAQELFEKEGPADPRELRYHLARRPLKLLWKLYVRKGGFREGWHGLVFCILYAWVHVLKWAKYWELSEVRRS